MAEFNIQEKINSYVAKHPAMQYQSDAVILSAMKQEGLITQAEIDAAKSTSAFGFGFNRTGDAGLIIETTTDNQEKGQKEVLQPIVPDHVQLETSQAKVQCLEILNESIQVAQECLNNLNYGAINSTYDLGKELAGSEHTTFKLQQEIKDETESFNLLSRSNEGNLTKKEYYLENKDRLKSMLLDHIEEYGYTGEFEIDSKVIRDRNTISRVVEEYIQQQIDSISDFASIKNMQTELLSMDEVQSTEFAQKTINEALKWQKDQSASSIEGSGNAIKIKAAIPEEFNSTEQISFEEIYRLECGNEFSTEMIENYMVSKAKMDIVTEQNNKLFNIHQIIEGINAYDDVQEQDNLALQSDNTRVNLGSEAEYLDNRLRSNEHITEKLNDFSQLLTQYYAMNPSLAKKEIGQIISENNLPMTVFVDSDGNVRIGVQDIQDLENSANLRTVMLEFEQKQKEKFDNLVESMGGMDAITNSYKQDYSNILGFHRSENMSEILEADDLAASMQQVIGGATTGGMILSVLGAVVCFIPGGQGIGAGMVSIGGKIAMGGMAAQSLVGYTEGLTRDNLNAEEISRLNKEAIMNIGGFVIGAQAGKIATKTFCKLVSEELSAAFSQQIRQGKPGEALKVIFENPQYLGQVAKATGAKLGTDFVISYAGDLAMMGILDTDDTWETLLRANLIGVVVGSANEISSVTSKNFGDIPRVKQQKTEDMGITAGRQSAERDALPADGIRNRLNQKRNQLYIRLQSIDGKYRDAAADRIDMSAPREVFELIDATPEELAKFIEKYTKEVEFADGSVDKRIVIGNFNYTPELLNAQIEHLRNLREFLDTQSIPAKMTVHRSDSYSIMEQIDINGRSLADIMQEAVENNKVEDVLKMLNEGEFDVHYDNFVGTSLTKLNWKDTKIQWEINVPKGSKGAYVELMTKENIPEEKEFLLQAGSTFKIRSVEFKDGVWNIKADLVQDSDVKVKPQAVKPEEVRVEEPKPEVETQKIEEVRPEVPHKPYSEMTDAEFEVAKAKFAEELKTIDKLDKYYYQYVLDHLNKSNFEIAKMMCTNEKVPVQKLDLIMPRINKQNAELAKIILSNDEYIDRIFDILISINETNIDFAKELCSAGKLNIHAIESILCSVNEINIDFARELSFNNDFPQNEIGLILRHTNQSNIEFARKLCADKDFPKDEIYSILSYVNDKNIKLAEQLSADKDFPIKYIATILYSTNEKNITLAQKLCADKTFPKEDIAGIIDKVNEQNIKLADLLCSDKELPKNEIWNVLASSKTGDSDAKIEIYNYIKEYDHLTPIEKILILTKTTNDNLEIAKILSQDKDFYTKLNEEVSDVKLRSIIIGNVNAKNRDFAKLLLTEQHIFDLETRDIAYLIYATGSNSVPICRIMDIDGLITTYNMVKVNNDIPASWKLDIIKTRISNIDGLQKLINLYNNMLKNPQKYINGEFTDEAAIKNVKDWFHLNAGGFLLLANNLDKEALDNLFRRRMDDVVLEYLPKVREFNELDFRVLKECNDACNIDGKPLMPTQKVEMIDLIKCYKDIGLDVAKLLPIDGKIDLGQAKIELFNEMMRKSGLTDAEIARIPKEKLVMWDTTYAHFMADEIIENKALQDLLRAANLDDFERYIHDLSNGYGKANSVTREAYNVKGMNYEAWLHPSKSSEITFKAMDKNQKRLIQVSEQIIEDIETLRQTPARGFIDKQFPQCIKDGKFFIPAEYLTSKEKLAELVKKLSDTSEQGQLTQMWQRAQNNSASEDPSKVARARNTLTILDHLNQRLDDISKIEKAESTKSFDVTIKMWDRVPQKDLFQGNYSTCCIGMGGGNGSAMPHFLLDTSYNMIELVDNNTGKTIGNALCYFVTGSDGKPKFIIDNIEINNAVKPSEEVGLALRQQITNYADNVAREVTGRDDIEIFMSAQYNDVPISDLKPRQDRVSFLGDTDCDDIYMDLYEGWVDHDTDASGNRTGSYTKNVKLLELKPQRDPDTDGLIQARRELAAMRGWNNKDAKFSAQEVDALAPVYAKNPDAARIALNRFSAQEVIVYKDYLNELNELSNLYGNRKGPRFTHDEILSLAQIYKTNKQQVLDLASVPKSRSGYYSSYDRFSADEIAVLAQVYTKENAGLIETLGQMRSLYSEADNRFSGKQIRAIVENIKPENIQSANNFAKTNIASRMDTGKFMEFVIQNQDLLPQLTGLAKMDLKGFDRFHNPEEILALAQSFKQYPEATKAHVLKPDYHGKTPLFRENEINALAPLYAKNPEATRIALNRFSPEEVIRYKDYLNDLNELSALYDHRSSSRFNHDEVLSLATTYNQFKDQVMALQDVTMGGSYYANHSRFTAEDIKILAPILTKENSKAIGYLMRVGHHDDAKFRFSATDIKNLVTAFTYKDKNGNVINNADNIVKILQLDKYKNISARDLYKIALQYDKNLGALVELGNIPETNAEVLKTKASDSYKVTETKTIVTADGDTKVIEVKKLNPQVEEQLRIIAKQLRADALGAEKSISEFMKENNLTANEYDFTHRSKSEQSLYDKLKNYLLDPKNADKTVADARKAVMDAVGTRTIIPTKDYTQHPEVKALLANNKRAEAVELAMKLQTEEMVKNLKNLLTKLKADGVENIGVLRFSNYKGKDGMPYISEAQLREIKELIDVEFDNLTEVEKNVFKRHGIELESEHFDTTERKSGYTAFQANFKTKDGYIFEWQFRGEKVNEFAEAEHVPYDLRTDKDIISGNPKAKEILEPIKDILSVKNMTDADFKAYNEYLTDYYKYCRELELGFTDAKPAKFDANRFDSRLKAENLILLHEYCDKLKNSPESKIPELVAEYKSKLIN